MWQYCSLVSPRRMSVAKQGSNSAEVRTISVGEWRNWLTAAFSESDLQTRNLAKYICAKTMAGSSYEKAVGAFASAVTANWPEGSDQQKLKLLLRSAILPAIVTSHRDARTLLANAPIDLVEADREIIEVIEILDSSVPQND